MASSLSFYSLAAPASPLASLLRLGFFAYVEGYRGFQKGFCPRVVSRAWAVSEKFPEVSARPGRQTRKYASGVLRLNWRIKVCIICCGVETREVP